MKKLLQTVEDKLCWPCEPWAAAWHVILSQMEMVMLGWCRRTSPCLQPCGNTLLLLLSCPFRSGVLLNVSSQIKVPRQLPTSYQGDLPQLERLNWTKRVIYSCRWNVKCKSLCWLWVTQYTDHKKSVCKGVFSRGADGRQCVSVVDCRFPSTLQN